MVLINLAPFVKIIYSTLSFRPLTGIMVLIGIGRIDIYIVELCFRPLTGIMVLITMEQFFE